MDRRRGIIRRSACCASQPGFTLIELLVVMSILALAASVVILNAPPSKPPARAAAETFAARIQTAFMHAVIESAPYRLEIAGSAYVISRFAEGQWEARFRMTVGGESEDVVFRVETASAAADNALALNGVSEDRRMEDSDVFLAPLDPYGGGPPIDAHFESRRGNWTVSIASDGAVTMERR